MNRTRAFEDPTRSEELDSTNSWVYRNWACYYASENEIERAIENLQKAIDLGYDDLEWIEEEETLNNLRDEDRYQQLIERLRTAASAQ